VSSIRAILYSYASSGDQETKTFDIQDFAGLMKSGAEHSPPGNV